MPLGPPSRSPEPSHAGARQCRAVTPTGATLQSAPARPRLADAVGVALVSKGPKTNRTVSSETPCSRSRDRGAPLRNAPRSQGASSQNRPHRRTSSGAGCGRGMPGARGLPSAPAQEAASLRGPRRPCLRRQPRRADGPASGWLSELRGATPSVPTASEPSTSASPAAGLTADGGTSRARSPGRPLRRLGQGPGARAGRDRRKHGAADRGGDAAVWAWAPGPSHRLPGIPPRQEPQHRAAGRGVPLVADVGSQSPAWTTPRNRGQRTLSAAPGQRSGRAACGPEQTLRVPAARPTPPRVQAARRLCCAHRCTGLGVQRPGGRLRSGETSLQNKHCPRQPARRKHAAEANIPQQLRQAPKEAQNLHRMQSIWHPASQMSEFAEGDPKQLL